MTQAFEITRPERRTTSVVFASPHSGRDYPQAFLDRAELDARGIRSSEDAFVDVLFDCAPDHGAPLLRAFASRAFVDLNRAPDELDPALIEGVRRPVHNPRVASGLGVIPRVVAGGRPIHRGRIALSEAQGRIDAYWRPYHEALQDLLAESHALFGEAVLIDCHSMPHEAIESIGGPGGPRPEVVLGDRFGAAASAGVVDLIEAAFVGAGLRVSRNMPFAGAYVVQHYGRPSRRQHAVQVEIDRSLYMDERLVEPSAAFDDFRRLLRGVVAEIASLGVPDGVRLAAE
ncbi:N-formylglutamate amidohydrolase [Rubellimicrobium aerolatum]|uniref:N-formylglutamate amidohydrolase n=1 Tax=Rubellimicrobium aerolatum TaxID=490979 RepID=A0ABW0SH49_9RHOB|nr:N-formylglutamate amidohydrolase [Rubellimicrobium aerolatum]MBP1806659.1 N-formylglutamate amidohydrolase [Rubellimicrobium aerolatum]